MSYRLQDYSGSSTPSTTRANGSVENGAGSLCRAVVLLSPGWPPGEIANGVVSSVATIKKGFEALGVNCSVLSISPHFRSERESNNVFHAASFDRWTQFRRTSQKLMNRLWRAPILSKLSSPRTNSTIPIPGFEEALKCIQQRNGIDLIEVEESFGLPAYVARCSHLPIVVRLHGPWFLTGAANGVEPNDAFHNRVRAEEAATVNADGVSSPSRFVLHAVAERYQTKLPISAIIPNAVEAVAEPSQWNPMTADPDHVLFVGRFDRLKGADVCLQSFVKVLQRRPQAYLTLVGPYEEGMVDKRTGRLCCAEEWLRKEVQPSQLRSRINLRGRLSCVEIDSLRLNAAVTIVPSRFETFSLTTAEAMAQGCPIVASRVGGIPEIIAHERNGLLCAAEDVDDLAAKILCMLGNRSLAAELGRNALQDSLTRFSPLVVAKQHLEFYEEVCSRRRATVSTSRSIGGQLRRSEHLTI